MAHEIRLLFDGWTNFTQTLAALTNGSARQSTMVSNTLLRWGALLDYRIESGGTAPTAGAIYEIFLIRGDGTRRTDNAGASDAGITVVNAQLIGTLQVTANTNTNFTDVFDTAPMGKLGSEFGTIARNSSGQTINATEANHTKAYNLYVPNFI